MVRQLFPPDSDIVGSINDQLAHFAAIQIGVPVQPLTRDQISAFVETAFWASLQSNEGRPTHVYLTFATPDGFPNAVAFALPVQYNEPQVVKLSPAVPSDGCLVVTGAAEEMNIWAIGRERRGPLTECVRSAHRGAWDITSRCWALSPIRSAQPQLNLDHCKCRYYARSFPTACLTKVLSSWRFFWNSGDALGVFSACRLNTDDPRLWSWRHCFDRSDRDWWMVKFPRQTVYVPIFSAGDNDP